MRLVVWLSEGTWEACVDAARGLATGGRFDDVVLLHVEDPATAEAWSAAPSGLLGRGGHEPDLDVLHAAAGTLLDDAAARLQGSAAPARDDAAREDADASRLVVHRDARTVTGRGALEREVVAVCADADVLVCARDGDRRHLGPHSLGAATRFVVDHAPCAVLLVWPDGVPDGAEHLPPLPPDPRRG